jgi:hypothetical protein
MDRPAVCPACLQRYADIRGMIYPDGGPNGHQCDDSWHDGEKYNDLKLSPEDKDLLRRVRIGF